MSNRQWVKPYKYTKVPVFFKRFSLFGYTLTIQSNKMVRRRVGAVMTPPKIWDLYEQLLTPAVKSKKGTPGFTRLMYRGLPVIQRDDMPVDQVGFIDRDKSRVRLLNWKTGKHSKYMSWDEFEAWIKRNRKLSTQKERGQK